MMKPSKFTIERAKRTLAGRLVCRLLGDQTGAVLMEYVVLGVLVVAAAVAMILVFGKQIRNSFKHMITATEGKHTTLQTDVGNDNTAIDNARATAATEGDAVAGGEVVQ